MTATELIKDQKTKEQKLAKLQGQKIALKTQTGSFTGFVNLVAANGVYLKINRVTFFFEYSDVISFNVSIL